MENSKPSNPFLAKGALYMLRNSSHEKMWNQVKDNSEFQWPHPRMQANHRNSQTVLVTWGRNSKFRALPSDTRSRCERQEWLLFHHVETWWVLADAFAREKGNSGNRGLIWMLCFSCHSPRLATKLLSPHFSHGSNRHHCRRRKQGRKRNPHETPCHQGWQPDRGSA